MNGLKLAGAAALLALSLALPAQAQTAAHLARPRLQHCAALYLTAYGLAQTGVTVEPEDHAAARAKQALKLLKAEGGSAEAALDDAGVLMGEVTSGKVSPEAVSAELEGCEAALPEL